MADNTNVKFYVGLSTALPAAESRDPNGLYFCTDTGQIYKGATIFTEPFKVVAALPEHPAQGVLYVAADGIVKTHTGTEWRTVALPAITAVGAASDDNHTPTAKAVYDAITTAVENATNGGDVINTIASTKAGIVTVTSGSNTTDVKVAGSVFNPTYDSDTRTITLPYNKIGENGSVTADSLVIALGKDMVVTSGLYNTVSHDIELTLTDGSVVKIPAGDLIDIYTGGATSTASVEVVDNTIKATVKVSAEADNAVVVKDDGLWVEDLSDEVDANTAAIAAINNPDTGILKQAKDYADGINTALSATISENATLAAQQAATAEANAKKYTDEQITAALTWGTF